MQGCPQGNARGSGEAHCSPVLPTRDLEGLLCMWLCGRFWKDAGEAQADTVSAPEGFQSSGRDGLTQSHVIKNKCLESV